MHDLPEARGLQAQADRLQGMRSHLLRRVGIAHRQAVLDLGCGWGSVTATLRRRALGPVVALDHHLAAVHRTGGPAIVGDAHALPFAAGTFDLVFTQFVWLWLRDIPRAQVELDRVLRPGGALVALEPDFGGMIEHPPEVALGDVWRATLTRAGASPSIGRRLPSLFRGAGYRVAVELVQPGDDTGPDVTLLEGLPLTPKETARVEQVTRANVPLPFVHLPVFGLRADKPYRDHRTVQK